MSMAGNHTRTTRIVMGTLVALLATGCLDGTGGWYGAPFAPTDPPVIDTQPVNQTVVEGQTATFTVVASGPAPLTYQWRSNGVDIPGEVSATYTTPALTLADSGPLVTCVVTNPNGSVTTADAWLTVTMAPPTITTQPADATVFVGETATFTVAATSSGALTYRWWRNGTDIPGATGPTYTTNATTPADDGAVFACVVSNAGGSITSDIAWLTVDTTLPSIHTQPTDVTVPQGETATFSVVASGPGTLTYQWQSSTDGGSSWGDVGGGRVRHGRYSSR